VTPSKPLSSGKPNSTSKLSTPVRFESNIPFARTNERLARRQHKHSPSTPHLVRTSRSPFRGETHAGASLHSTPDRSLAVQSVRGFYSLASPPRTTSPVRTQGHGLSPRHNYASPPSSPYHQPIRVCTNKFVYNLHPKMGPCNRCWALARPEEQERYTARGSHLRIVRTRGGCDRSCTIFPPMDKESPVRLCRQCFFATHQSDGSRLQVYRGKHVKVKLTI
jgi:hypothetical protein